MFRTLRFYHSFFKFLSTPSARRATAGAGGRSYRKGVFLSTPSARRATVIRRFSSARSNNFYPRPPRGERQHHQGAVSEVQRISIHALREESDGRIAVRISTHQYFYPRPPRGERHFRQPRAEPHGTISIHALREESDSSLGLIFSFRFKFLSTPSARRATAQTPKQGRVKHDFYPRPPRGERPETPNSR